MHEVNTLEEVEETQLKVAETFTTSTSTDTVCSHKNFSCIDEVIEDVIRQSVEEFTPQPSALSCPQPSAASIRTVRFSEEFNLHLSSSDDDTTVDEPGNIDGNALATTNHLGIPATVKNLKRKYQRREAPAGSPRVTRARKAACAPLLE